MQGYGTEFGSITATEAGMELPEAALKIGAAGKWQHFQKDFFYRLVGLILGGSMSIGVLVFEGMKVGFLPGDFKISLDESDEAKSHAILSTAYNVLPIWLRVARDNLNQSKTASNDIEKNWNNADDSERKELLITELEPSLQVFVSCAIVLDALYYQLRPYAKLSQNDTNKWRDNRTGRAKQIAEVIRRVYKLDKDIFKQFRQNISEIIKYRDLAVHPSLELKNSSSRPDIPVGVDWKFAMYRYPNSERCFVSTIGMLRYLHKNKCDEKGVLETMENVFKALHELKVIE